MDFRSREKNHCANKATDVAVGETYAYCTELNLVSQN